MSYKRIPDEDYQRLTTELKWQVGKTLGVFNCHGLGEYLPEVTSIIVGLAEDFAMAVRGKDTKIKANYTREKPTG